MGGLKKRKNISVGLWQVIIDDALLKVGLDGSSILPASTMPIADVPNNARNIIVYCILTVLR